MDYVTLLVQLVMCHMIGDYVLQSTFIATTKGTNWYHLFVHCFLYCVPFAIMLGINESLGLVFVAHCVIDPLKARWNKISYVSDQILHYLTLILAYILF